MRFRPFTRRARRADDGRYTPKDSKQWRALVKAVRYQVRAPLADPAPLLKAAMDCHRAVPPSGHACRDSVFLALLSTARGFAGLDAVQREAKIQQLAGLADTVAAILELADHPPGRPPRADLYG